jgi:hypothetical protein
MPCHRPALLSTQPFSAREQCAEAPAGRRSVTLQLPGRGGGQIRPGGVPSGALSWCCSSRRRLPALRSVWTASRQTGRRRTGRTGQDACFAGCRRSASTIRYHPIRAHPSGSGCPAVRCPARPVPGHLVPSPKVRLSGRPVSASPASRRLVSARPSCRVRLAPRVSPTVGLGDQIGAAGQPSRLDESSSIWAATSPSGSVDGPSRPDARNAAAEAVRRSVGATAALDRCPSRPAWGEGCRPLAAAPGDGADRSATLLHLPHGCRLSRMCDYSLWSSWDLPPGWTAQKGPTSLPARMATRPQRGPAGQERDPLGAAGAVTCGNRGWACQDLNLGPHPYQLNAGNRCAKRRSRR